MLTGTQVRVRIVRGRVVPLYLQVDDPVWLGAAERLLELFRGREGCARGVLNDEVDEAFGNLPNQPVYQGLAQLLEDRSEFEVQSSHDPVELRKLTFQAATAARRDPKHGPGTRFARQSVLQEVGSKLGLTSDEVDRGLFADLKSEERLVRFEDIPARRLLERYNLALAQAVLLRSTRVRVALSGETPARVRQILRQVKFRRLVCEAVAEKGGSLTLNLDGPLSLFSATQKYGLQLALFLPAILACRTYQVTADVLWGPQRKPRTFTLTHSDGLISHGADTGQYVPPEVAMFADLFRKKISDWELAEEAEVLPLGKHFWVPDFRLQEKKTGRIVHLDVLGYWRRSSLKQYLERLKEHAPGPFILALSDQLHVEEGEVEGLPALIHRFRNMPLPDEIARLAAEVLASQGIENQIPITKSRKN